MSENRWCCTVCGYVHLGSIPPACCPVCGATPDLFEQADPLPSSAGSAPRNWRCITCDYLHAGDSPPGCCPICAAGADRFEPVAEPARISADRAVSGDIVVVGGGIAGLSAAEAARNAAPEASVTLICLENDLPYYRLNLTRYLAGEIPVGDLPVHPESWYAAQRITILTGAEVTGIDRTARTVSLQGHPPVRYDRLVLAMGAHSSMPPVPGADLRHVFTLRTCSDAETILEQSRPGVRCVIVGGGVLGLEVAAALARRALQVTVVEGFDWLLPRQLNRAAGERIAREVRALGIGLVCSVRISRLDGRDQVEGVILESGDPLPADLVILAAGIRSNTYLARLAGLDVNSGVVVDQHLRTSDPDIFAAGDLAEHQGTVYGTWAPAQFQGTIAGMNAAGGDAVFAGIPRSHGIKVLGVDLFSIGVVHPDDASYLVFEEDGDRYRQYIFRDSRLVGAILLGDTALAPVLKKLIEGGTSCADLLAGAGDAREVSAGIARMA